MALSKVLASLHATPFWLNICAHWHANTVCHQPQNVWHAIGGYCANPSLLRNRVAPRSTLIKLLPKLCPQSLHSPSDRVCATTSKSSFIFGTQPLALRGTGFGSSMCPLT